MWKPKRFKSDDVPADMTRLSKEDYLQIVEHVEHCPSCHSSHEEFTSFLAQMSSSEFQEAKEQYQRHVKKGQVRERFIERAREAGIPLSTDAWEKHNRPAVPPEPAYRWVLAGALAGVIAILAGQRFLHNASNPVPITHAQVSNQTANNNHHGENHRLEAKLLELQAANNRSESEFIKLRNEASKTLAQLTALKEDLMGKRAENQALRDSLAHVRELSAKQAAQNDENLKLVAQSEAELEASRIRETDLETEAGTEKAELAALSQQLSSKSTTIDHDRELLAAGRDITDLMGARNLHIIDVRDADGKGKDKRSFGRIFYTEGKSLIFYAYDLDEGRVEKADYSFEVWGERLGEPTSVRSLGILYTDRKDHERWALTVDDPHQLAEIDSVFVTLEPHQGNRSPRGGKILFAFLGGRANHP